MKHCLSCLLHYLKCKHHHLSGNLTVKSFFRFAGGRGENLSFVVDIGVGHLTPYVRGRGEFENVVLQLLESSKT